MAFDETITAGTTSKIIEVTLRSSSTGNGSTAIAHGSVTASYVREGGTRVAITLAAGTAGDAYSSGKWAEVDATNMRGVYQLHVPNAALAAGVAAVTIRLQASGVIDKDVRVALIGIDVRDADGGGMSRLDENVSAAKTLTTGERSSVAAAVRTNLTTELGRIDENVSAAKTLTTGERSSVAAAVRTNLTTELGRIDENVSAAKTLTAGERTAIAVSVAADILNDSDGSAVLQAIADQIAADWVAGDASPLAIVSAINADATIAAALANMDAAVSTRLPTSSYTVAPSAAAVATQVRTELTVELGRIDENVSAAKTLTTGERTAIVAAVNADPTIAAALANMDAAVSTRLAASSYTAAPTAATVADAVWTETIGDHSGTAGSTAEALANAGGGGGASAADIADAVWTEALTDHTGTSGSTAEALAAAGSAGDPWITNIPGSYSGTQAGNVVATLLESINNQTSAISTDGLSIVGPVLPGGEISLVVGDDYHDDNATTIDRDVADAGQTIYDILTDVSVSSIKFAAGYGSTGDVITGTVTQGDITHAAGETTIPIEIPAANLANADHLREYTWQIQATYSSGKKRTVLTGPLSFAADMAL